jgi:hypothetical protein
VPRVALVAWMSTKPLLVLVVTIQHVPLVQRVATARLRSSLVAPRMTPFAQPVVYVTPASLKVVLVAQVLIVFVR